MSDLKFWKADLMFGKKRGLSVRCMETQYDRPSSVGSLFLSIAGAQSQIGI